MNAGERDDDRPSHGLLSFVCCCPSCSAPAAEVHSLLLVCSLLSRTGVIAHISEIIANPNLHSTVRVMGRSVSFLVLRLVIHSCCFI